MQWLLDSFRNDPAGWIAVGIAVLAIVLSAVFWKRVGGVIVAILRAPIRAIRFLASLRIVRAPRRAHRHLPPARWDVVKEKGASTEDFVLANFGEGSIARDVQIEPYDDDYVVMRSSGFWPRIDGGEIGRFKAIISPEALFASSLAFSVFWTDGNGTRQRHLISKGR